MGAVSSRDENVDAVMKENGLRNLHTRYLHQIDSYHARVEEQLRESGFYHTSQIGRIWSHGPTIDTLVERWRPKTHTFHLPHGECIITLEDIAMIFGLRTHCLPVTGSTNHSTSGLENECMTQFGSAPGPNDHSGCGIKLAWLNDYQSAIEQHKNWTTVDVRRRLDNLSPDGFVWDSYSPNQIALHVIPFEINDGADL
ncbi:serine/threonine-protein phosphatase 7 long form homolog [Arachis ipaensis]|uniref:serine/threonine-protein phosphatase 7 long form homolog n=1 Tax=Arachis ipaensis TaxID=130454 RepID=UPI0007AF878E|nr:serine/threonine-protein phosphatase 7 long form homolog [Arachis ipaensis]